MSAVRVRLNLLDPFLLRQGDQLLAGFDHARLHHLLAYLVLHQIIPITRQRLAFAFWPDATNQQALKNLRTLLTRLRHAVPDAVHFIVRKIVGEPFREYRALRRGVAAKGKTPDILKESHE